MHGQSALRTADDAGISIGVPVKSHERNTPHGACLSAVVVGLPQLPSELDTPPEHPQTPNLDEPKYPGALPNRSRPRVWRGGRRWR